MAYNRRRKEKKRDTGGQGGSDSLRRPSPPPISRTTTPKQSLEFPAGKIHSITPSNTNPTVESLTPSSTKSSTLPHQSVNNPEATPPTPPLPHLNPSRITIRLQSTPTRRGEGAAPVDAAAREGEGKGGVGDAGVVVKMAGAARVRR
ncbi:hypothetical protein Droror1_Dr00019913 [Drosera rotundifolia]